VPSLREAAIPISFSPTAGALEGAIAAIENAGDRSGSSVDADGRRAAFARYEALPIPGSRPGGAWRHNYAKLVYDELTWSSDRLSVATLPFGPAPAPGDVPALATDAVAGIVHAGSTLLVPPSLTAPRGVFVAALGDARRGTGVIAGTGSVDAFPRPFRVLEDAYTHDKFAALATAFQNCGALVYVAPGVVLDAPIQLVFANADDTSAAVFPHILVVLGEGARATVFERHVGEGRPFVCGVTAVHLGDRAELDYVAIQNAGEEARVMMYRTGECGREAQLRWHVADLGATLARSTIHARLDHPGASAQISSLFFNIGFQHVDLTTTVDHVVGDTTSNTVVRSAASDRGQGRYFGNIAIAPHAQGSDAFLRDDVLLLSKRAHIDSVPALEIAANGVKAFHGATVGSLDTEQLFYAQSRGIPEADAVRMIALAFFEPAISRFPGEALRDEVRTLLDAKIDDATDIHS
jgi:FeS assembly protein SufD